jgi:protocatechuate 3,4-dioxygenase, alpha subunit
MTVRGQTPSQTVGPYFAIGFGHAYATTVFGPGTPGVPVTLSGSVLDGDGQPVPDAYLEIWQADAQGHHEQGKSGFGRIATGAAGAFRVTTIRPGPVAGPDGKPMAPHLAVSVFARGILRRLATRMYFPDEPANADDSILARVPAERRRTLIARAAGDGALEWNIVLQGPGETVFFDFA